jgi:hypothetical protein
MLSISYYLGRPTLEATSSEEEKNNRRGKVFPSVQQPGIQISHKDGSRHNGEEHQQWKKDNIGRDAQPASARSR